MKEAIPSRCGLTFYLHRCQVHIRSNTLQLPDDDRVNSFGSPPFIRFGVSEPICVRFLIISYMHIWFTFGVPTPSKFLVRLGYVMYNVNVIYMCVSCRRVVYVYVLYMYVFFPNN